MKIRKFNIKSAIIFIIILPILPIYFILYSIYLLNCSIKEKPLYYSANYYKVTKRKYSHTFFKSDYYKLCNEIYKYCDLISLKCNNNKKYEFICNNSYFFSDKMPLYFEIKNDKLFVSLDGYPEIFYQDYINSRNTTMSNKYLLVFEETLHTLNYKKLSNTEIERFGNIIVASSFEEFAKKIINIEHKENPVISIDYYFNK